MRNSSYFFIRIDMRCCIIASTLTAIKSKIQKMFFRISCVLFASCVSFYPPKVFFGYIMIIEKSLIRIRSNTTIPIIISASFFVRMIFISFIIVLLIIFLSIIIKYIFIVANVKIPVKQIDRYFYTG